MKSFGDPPHKHPLRRPHLASPPRRPDSDSEAPRLGGAQQLPAGAVEVPLLLQPAQPAEGPALRRPRLHRFARRGGLKPAERGVAGCGEGGREMRLGRRELEEPKPSHWVPLEGNL